MSIYKLYHGYPPTEHEDMLNMELVAGDTLPEYPFYLKDQDGADVDMTGFVAEMHVAYAVPLTIPANIIDPTGGEFFIDFGPGDLVQGIYSAEIQVTNSSGKIRTWQKIKLIITPEIL